MWAQLNLCFSWRVKLKNVSQPSTWIYLWGSRGSKTFKCEGPWLKIGGTRGISKTALYHKWLVSLKKYGIDMAFLKWNLHVLYLTVYNINKLLVARGTKLLNLHTNCLRPSGCMLHLYCIHFILGKAFWVYLEAWSKCKSPVNIKI